MEIITNGNTFTVKIGNINNVTWDDFVKLSIFINENPELLQVDSLGFVFSDKDIQFIKNIPKKNKTMEKIFNDVKNLLLKEIALKQSNFNEELYLFFSDKANARCAHVFIWFFKKKLVPTISRVLLFNSQDLANFDYDLILMSNHFNSNGNLKTKQKPISKRKENKFNKNLNRNYCSLGKKRDQMKGYELISPLPIPYKLE